MGLYRSGTRIVASLAQLEAFQKTPWTEGCLQGIVDAPFLNLTPATRTGVIHDAALEAFVEAMAPIEARLGELIEERRRAEDERSSRDTLKTIQRAFREAMLALPAEDYDWFDIQAPRRQAVRQRCRAVSAAEFESCRRRAAGRSRAGFRPSASSSSSPARCTASASRPRPARCRSAHAARCCARSRATPAGAM